MPSRSPQTKLRIAVLAGLGLCVLSIVLTLIGYPALIHAHNAQKFLLLIGVGVLFCAFAAARYTKNVSAEEDLVLNIGTKWGVAIGLSWTVEVVFANIVTPHAAAAPIGLLAAGAGAILPVVAGALGAQRIKPEWTTGLRVGLWSGLISGLIAFLVLAGTGHLVAHFPALPGSELLPDASGLPHTAQEIAQFNVGEYLGAAVMHLFLVGALFCGFAGALGGLIVSRIKS